MSRKYDHWYMPSRPKKCCCFCRPRCFFFFLFFYTLKKCSFITSLIYGKLADQNNVSCFSMFQSYGCVGTENICRYNNWRKTSYGTGTIQKQTENTNSCCARSFHLKVRLDRRVNTRHLIVANFIVYGHCQIP